MKKWIMAVIAVLVAVMGAGIYLSYLSFQDRQVAASNEPTASEQLRAHFKEELELLEELRSLQGELNYCKAELAFQEKVILAANNAYFATTIGPVKYPKERIKLEAENRTPIVQSLRKRIRACNEQLGSYRTLLDQQGSLINILLAQTNDPITESGYKQALLEALLGNSFVAKYDNSDLPLKQRLANAEETFNEYLSRKERIKELEGSLDANFSLTPDSIPDSYWREYLDNLTPQRLARWRENADDELLPDDTDEVFISKNALAEAFANDQAQKDSPPPEPIKVPPIDMSSWSPKQKQEFNEAIQRAQQKLKKIPENVAAQLKEPSRSEHSDDNSDLASALDQARENLADLCEKYGVSSVDAGPKAQGSIQVPADPAEQPQTTTDPLVELRTTLDDARMNMNAWSERLQDTGGKEDLMELEPLIPVEPLLTETSFTDNKVGGV